VFLYFRRMSDAELISFFENTDLPESLRIDRATTQHELPRYAKYYTDLLKQKPADKNVLYWLLRVKKAIDEPFAGQDIPRL
jgi:hypothetical protein